MMNRKPFLCAGIAGLAFALGGCGGGGGGLASIPAPPPTPTPAPLLPTTLNVVAHALTGELAVAGATTSAPYADPQPFANLTIERAGQPSFRYDSTTDVYEAKLPGGSWETLQSMYPENAATTRTDAQADSGAEFHFGREWISDSDLTYVYSTIASYFAPNDVFGWLAVGVPTPSSGLPNDGSATFNGILAGQADYNVDDGWGGAYPTWVGGTVTLNFDFGTSRLSGSIDPTISLDAYGATWESLGEFTFKNGVYSAGAYSGQFNSPVSGLNGFYGQLTGPHGEELIGAWALPFHYSRDDKDHQAMGAWVAKRP